jgi:hypothetical protein
MIDDPRIAYLVANYTPEGKAGNPPIKFGNDFQFYVGKDDVHGILVYLLSNELTGFKMNMFGFDDQQLNDLIMAMLKNPDIHVQVSLDKSQSAGVHEKNILAADIQSDPTGFNSSVVILESATNQISHTKGGILAGQGLYFGGSTNWSASGEGTGISLTPGVNSVTGYKAQNNTLTVSANPVNLNRFSVELDEEHQVGLAKIAKSNNK